MKSQILTDLVVKFAELPEEIEVRQRGLYEKLVGLVSMQVPSSWRVYVDGVANQQGSRVGLILVSPKRITIEKSLKLGFSATNNEVEYEVVLMGLTMVQKMGGKTM